MYVPFSIFCVLFVCKCVLYCCHRVLYHTISLTGVRGSTVSWGTALQAGRSRVRFSTVPLEFFVVTNLPDTLWLWGRLSPYQEYFLCCKGGRRVGLTNLSRSCADYLEIWEPQTLATMRACPGVWWACFTFIWKLLFHIFLLMIIRGSPESLKRRHWTYLILFHCTPSRILCLRSVKMLHTPNFKRG
jgi:hypothetical protein